MAPIALRDHPLEVWIVHAEIAARREILECLADPGIICREAASGGECLRAVQNGRPDLLILDLYLPDQSGLGVCRLIREAPRGADVPIMVVSSQASEIDRVLAFEAGADDFVARPFYPAELRARVDAVLRGFRSRPERAPKRARGLVRVDTRAGRIRVLDADVELTHKEYELLTELMGQAGRVVRRKQLIERLWGASAPRSDRAIDAHIKSIRRKLGTAGRCIETVRGVGYRFVDAQVAERTASG
ncbi:MAG TPA: response regulator transcription factor [Myxococcota bacterium]|nr:response regulator transcription factor [Myxococcota bacterium]